MMLKDARETYDVDIAIAVRSDDLEQQLDKLDTRRGVYLRGQLHGMDVDVLPFGADFEPSQELEIDGVVWDLAGLSDAYLCAETYYAKNAAFRCPTLASLIILKLIAWDTRGNNNGRTKDAQDLALLLDACGHGDYADEVLGHPAAERYEWDPYLAGPYVQGIKAQHQMGPAVRARVRDAIAPRMRVLADGQPRTDPRRIEQYEAFFSGFTALP
ncbi:putative nucleotidyltransferase [Flexivirga oryzae]|uniref:Putative nucleotidyltransferase n=2 Tax=Flexivirga oryzae TaxID=1794944 RepID=A0A839N7J1_9MICO|nr:nucleotidyl transferase AbiEii/AbiGii toxin family protein [Flexivirga oryzae]MBB2893740.1 putative nucleotidyltransferase [Flexivirga oryzae]